MNDSTRLARAAVTELLGCGIRHVVLAPGSRSAPLAYALYDAEQAGRLRLHVRLDERDAGFLALGIARGLRARGENGLAAVVTTSGTAVANLHPAVLEASYSRLPMLVLSADRPAELRGTGSNQTMRQQGALFGAELRATAELPAPEPGDLADAELRWRESLRRLIQEAVAGSGPVQANAAFRDPLVPEDATPWGPGRADAEPLPAPRDGWESEPDASASPGSLAGLGPRPVLVAGETGGAGPGEGALRRAAELAADRGWPVLAEPSSGLRSHPHAIPRYREVLAAAAGPAPEITGVLTLGRPTLSRPVARLLARSGLPQIVISPEPEWFGAGVPGATLLRPAELPAQPEAPHAEPSWLRRWREAGNARPLGQDAAAPLDRAAAAALLAEPEGLLLAGSSSVIRDLDAAMTPAHRARVHASRGLAGIDGLISTAAGLALGSGEPVRAVIGDISALHDLGGLVLPSLEARPALEVVVVNDDGGSIFAGLEHGRPQFADRFPRLFGTPHGLGFGPIAAALGWEHLRADTAGQLRAALAGGVVPGRLLEIVPAG
ncbi:2-succinyl-5-enolpyruvyl-6-hydroxy-3-cyclohexene-1-carboxylic-acid synthase [Sediminivirga luteola]|uniref:2-succinyl-5-enolpyruvyl-6-hydroxy-3-cyclohexene-1-carboxylate synthase n=1 Tax=Sediminivirga luteola TaxID=1774748 RepID=A0A8J2TX61_9MICO|nr:2-succinyl-5-enolpyruvyl-6-hydroxy-3-cyclohexene-1-carboxylic-acid synthase [Sediminivirga luteola]MCI2265430.1 2-succinyl-5-enolpyruvyl-6-hydroxy-3-cyclohexene-1-carboxylic-acid synthase [Sediminivirga luteola]GGA11241.1 2-succinyl-5-enolpyruvyl-6-hydroxy-3-cyclohexene-1-carboxylate synthase [Sediminivirga luteola]